MNRAEIIINTKPIQKIIALIAQQSYGIVGLSSKNNLWNQFNDLLNTNKYQKGVRVANDENDDLIIDVYIIVKEGLPIKQIVGSFVNKIEYELKDHDLIISEINIFIMGVR